MINWMDSREPQVINEVMTIYDKTKAIRTAIEHGLASFRESPKKEEELSMRKAFSDAQHVNCLVLYRWQRHLNLTTRRNQVGNEAPRYHFRV